LKHHALTEHNSKKNKDNRDDHQQRNKAPAAVAGRDVGAALGTQSEVAAQKREGRSQGWKQADDQFEDYQLLQ